MAILNFKGVVVSGNSRLNASVHEAARFSLVSSKSMACGSGLRGNEASTSFIGKDQLGGIDPMNAHISGDY